MITRDLRKELKYLYSPSAKKVEEVVVPGMNFAMIDGCIEPGHGPGTSPAFRESLQALYGISYTLKFMLKKRVLDPVDYPVMALEGLWWVEGAEFQWGVKDNWVYTVMIMQPDFITPEVFAEGLAQLRKKKGDQPALAQLRLEAFDEGLCVQVMHIGHYSTEPATVARMDEYAQAHGYQMHGRHHEIYLGDPMRADPAKLKTILRHPVKVSG